MTDEWWTDPKIQCPVASLAQQLQIPDICKAKQQWNDFQTYDTRGNFLNSTPPGLLTILKAFNSLLEILGLPWRSSG